MAYSSLVTLLVAAPFSAVFATAAACGGAAGPDARAVVTGAAAAGACSPGLLLLNKCAVASAMMVRN